MFEFLLSSEIACTDADAMILRIEKHENLKAEWKLELIETIQDYTSDSSASTNNLRFLTMSFSLSLSIKNGRFPPHSIILNV